MSKKHIVKRHGHREEFDEKKLYASIYTSCLVARSGTRQAEITANLVLDELSTWLRNKGTLITSNDIRRQAANILNQHNPDAAYTYLHHRVVW